MNDIFNKLRANFKIMQNIWLISILFPEISTASSKIKIDIVSYSKINRTLELQF